MTTPIPIKDRIKRLTEVTSEGCWRWLGTINNCGYGNISVRENSRTRTLLAHRVSYEAHVGPVGAGLVLDHLCRNRACVNPAHLEPVTMRENVMRSPVAIGSANAAKTHCANGHPYTDANTRFAVRPNGTTRTRTCRICSRAAAARYRARKAAALTEAVTR